MEYAFDDRFKQQLDAIDLSRDDAKWLSTHTAMAALMYSHLVAAVNTDMEPEHTLHYCFRAVNLLGPAADVRQVPPVLRMKGVSYDRFQLAFVRFADRIKQDLPHDVNNWANLMQLLEAGIPWRTRY